MTAKQAHDRSAPVKKPPAKKTNPDANDAAARKPRACPRPVGYVVQLLLVALYMSTYDERPSPDQNAVRAHLTTHHARNGSIISNHRNPARRQPSTTTQRPLVVIAKQARDQSAPVVRPPAKKTNPDANDAAAKSERACPRPVGYVVQLLLVALYMSTYDDGPSPDQHAVILYHLRYMTAAASF